jgi:DNA-directed RNA polymerase
MHASAIEDLNDALRLSALEIFEEDQIQAFHEQMVELSGLDLPEPPSRGEYRIEEILDAPYFFS